MLHRLLIALLLSLISIGGEQSGKLRPEIDVERVLVVRGCFWADKTKDDLLQQACIAAGGTFVDLGALGKDESNYARSERKFEHAGVAAHPGDKGMKAIADAILNALKIPGK